MNKQFRRNKYNNNKKMKKNINNNSIIKINIKDKYKTSHKKRRK